MTTFHHKKYLMNILPVISLLLSCAAFADTCPLNQVCTLPANGSLVLQKTWPNVRVTNSNHSYPYLLDYKTALQLTCKLWYPLPMSNPSLQSFVTLASATFVTYYDGTENTSPVPTLLDIKNAAGGMTQGSLLPFNQKFTLGGTVHVTEQVNYPAQNLFSPKVTYVLANQVNKDVMVQCMEYQPTTPSYTIS